MDIDTACELGARLDLAERQRRLLCVHGTVATLIDCSHAGALASGRAASLMQELHVQAGAFAMLLSGLRADLAWYAAVEPGARPLAHRAAVLLYSEHGAFAQLADIAGTVFHGGWLARRRGRQALSEQLTVYAVAHMGHAQTLTALLTEARSLLDTGQ